MCSSKCVKTSLSWYAVTASKIHFCIVASSKATENNPVSSPRLLKSFGSISRIAYHGFRIVRCMFLPTVHLRVTLLIIIRNAVIGKNDADDAPSHQDSPKRRYRRLGSVTVQLSHSQKLHDFYLSFAQHTRLSGRLVTDDNYVVQTCMAPALRTAARGTLRRGLLQGNHPKDCIQLLKSADSRYTATRH